MRITLSRKGQTVQTLTVVRILKPAIGMGMKFVDVEAPFHEILALWPDRYAETAEAGSSFHLSIFFCAVEGYHYYSYAGAISSV
jgi:hypothetical protein